jgi:hypothetical protein
MRLQILVVYSAHPAPYGVAGPRHSQWRMILALTVLACFVLIQDPAAEALHHHSHSGAHTHCCPACHGGHLSALQGMGVAIPAPSTSEWNVISNQLPASVRLIHSSGSSRAPPA